MLVPRRILEERKAPAVVGLALIAVTVAIGQVRAGQVELDQLPATVAVQVDVGQRLELGIHAVEPMVRPTLGGRRLVEEMPHEATLAFLGDGTTVFSYHDLFLRHYHDREQSLTEVEGALVEDLNHLPQGVALPKILMDAWYLDAPDLYLDGSSDRLWWTGTLEWRFNVGLAVTSLSLASPQGTGVTVVDDTNWPETGQPVTVSVSRDGASWIEVWRSSGNGGESVVTASLPPALEGSTVLYVRLQSGGSILSALYVTLGLDGKAVEQALQIDAGTRELDVGSDGGGAALVFWTNPGVQLVQDPSQVPDSVKVHITDSRVAVSFPQGGRIELCRGPGGAVTGPCLVRQDGTTVLEAPLGGTEESTLELVDGGSITAYTDWDTEVDHVLSTGSWRSNGQRTSRSIALAGGQLTGTTVQPDGSVLVSCIVVDGSHRATLVWELRPVSRMLAGRRWRGVSWRVHLQGLEEGSHLSVTEPAVLPVGSWWIEQVFRGLTDDQLDLATPYHLPAANTLGASQSFHYLSGPDGSVVGLFETPVVTRVRVREERARRLIRLRIPLGTGPDRATPWRSWLVESTGSSDAWAARDLWAELRDGIVSAMAREQGFAVSRPRPTLVWNQPTGDYYSYWIAHGQPPGGVFWFDWAREHLLPQAAQRGMETLYIQPPWESDAEHFEDGSGNAPWDLVVSPALGGERAMAAFITRAHELGLQVILWYPSSYSLHAPIFIQHPDWVAFGADGTPFNGGWPDVVGVDLRSGYLGHAIARLAALQGRLHPDGYWLDSWDGITLMTDFKHARPVPQTAGAETLLRTMWSLGVRQVITEGLGPLARGDAFGDYESWSGPPVPTPGPLRDLAEVRGREYLLYRIGASLLPDSEVYFRTMAAGGMVNINNLDELTYLEAPDLERIEAANRAFAAVGNLLEHRRLVVRDGRWAGVAWEDASRHAEVLFAFSDFSFTVPAGARITEVSGATPTSVEPVDGAIEARAWAVYRIVPAAPPPRHPAGRIPPADAGPDSS